MPRCPQCRAINSPGAKHCSRCQQSFGPESNSNQDVWPQSSVSAYASHESQSDQSYANAYEQWFSPDTEDGELTEHPAPASGLSALDQFSTGPEPHDPSISVTQTGPVRHPQPETAAMEATSDQPGSGQESPLHYGRLPRVVGDVFMVRDMAPEPPDANPFLWLARLLGVSLLIEALILFFWGAYQAYGLLILIAVVLCFFLLSRFLGNIFFFSLLGAGRLLGSIFSSNDRQVPVKNVRIMDDHQEEHVVRIKGHIIRGDVAEYDRVAVWGPRRRGTVLFRYGYNLRARGSICLEGRYTWILALIFLGLNVWLILGLLAMYQG